MRLTLTAEQRTLLEAAQARRRTVRHWRRYQAVVAANRAYTTVQEQAERAVAWLAALTPFDRLPKSGLFETKFRWLST